MFASKAVAARTNSAATPVANPTRRQPAVTQHRTGAALGQPALSGQPRIVQRGVGNQAMLRRLEAGPARLRTAPDHPAIQLKPVISTPDDPYEREADAVTEQVMRMADPVSVAAAPASVQRKCAACEDEENAPIQTKSDAPGQAVAQPDPSAAISAAKRGGNPLPKDVRSWFEPRFGYDFSHVVVHADAEAAKAARGVRARAYTTGRDIVFGSGEYAPGSVAGRHLLAHELVHVVQQGRQRASGPPIHAGSEASLVAREPAPPAAQDPTPAPPATAPAAPAPAAAATPAAAPGACAFNCTDASFLTLDPAARETQFTAQCPQGYPVTGTTFFGQPIPAVSKTLRGKLLEAQAHAMRAMCLGGQDPGSYTLDRSIITYAGHSPGMDKAVDIDVQGQPYIMHESHKDPDASQGERDIDKETGPVYDRIAFWSLFRKSVIPKGIASVSRAPKTSNTDRTWTDPETGTKNTATTTGELYDKLKAESTGMQGYFNLLFKSDQELASEIFAFNAVNTDGTTDLAKLKIPTDESDASVKTFRQRIADDYRLLGGSRAQLEAFAGKPIADASKTPPTHLGDRPFAGGTPEGTTLKKGAPDPSANRRPELGFISLPKEVVVALTEVGLIWGAIDFGGESGDVMHFDCRNIPKC